jgi:hypothetical protein
MKAIKDCKWYIEIADFLDGSGHCYWVAGTDDNTSSDLDTLTGYDFKTLQGCKRNWERFAKINGIKKWKYI